MTKTERISHYAIMIVAVSALVVSVWQVQISQQHNRLSVRPYMDFFSGWKSADQWQLTLSNEGVGPAIIQEIDYHYQGKTYANWDECLEAAGLRKFRTNSATFGKNSPFAVDKTVIFLELKRNEEALRQSLGINVLIKYESVYEEPFELSISF
jgi:hypothetical protein